MKKFDSELFGKLRVEMINDEPWFVANDVTDSLGYEKGRNAVTRHVDEPDALKRGISSGGQMREATWINEAGVYALIFGSKLDGAKAYKKWVFSEVLPVIRKTGGYVSDTEQIVNTLFGNMGELQKGMIKSLLDNQKENQGKIQYHDTVLSTEGTMSITEVAKEFGKTAQSLNKLLVEEGVQFKRGKQYVLKAKYQSMGLTKMSTTPLKQANITIHALKWTEKGRKFIHELLAA